MAVRQASQLGIVLVSLLQARQEGVTVSAAELADEVGYSLEQSHGWDRLESVKDTFMDRYSSRVRVRPDAASSWNVDFSTSHMIKKALRAVTP